MKKTIISWAVCICVLIVIGSVLFVTGQQHDIIIDNKSTEESMSLATANCSIDNLKEKKVKNGKKAAIKVKGRNHTISIDYTKLDGTTAKIEKTFVIKNFEKVTLNIPNLVANKEWIKRER